MKLRYITSILAGALAELITLMICWRVTEMGIVDLFIAGYLAYMAGLIGCMRLTRTKEAIHTRKHTEPQIYTLSKEDYYKLEETA